MVGEQIISVIRKAVGDEDPMEGITSTQQTIDEMESREQGERATVLAGIKYFTLTDHPVIDNFADAVLPNRCQGQLCSTRASSRQLRCTLHSQSIAIIKLPSKEVDIFNTGRSHKIHISAVSPCFGIFQSCSWRRYFGFREQYEY